MNHVADDGPPREMLAKRRRTDSTDGRDLWFTSCLHFHLHRRRSAARTSVLVPRHERIGRPHRGARTGPRRSVGSQLRCSDFERERTPGTTGAQLTTLSQQLDEKTDASERLEKELSTLRDQYAELESSIEQARQSTEAEEDRFRQANDQISELQDQCESLRSDLEQAHADKNAAELRITANESAALDAGDELRRQTELIDSLNKKNESQADQIQVLKEQVASLTDNSEADVAEREDLIAKLKTDLSETEMYREATQDKLDAVREELELGKTTLQDRDESIERLGQQVAELVEQIESKDEKIAELESDLETLGELERQRDEIEQQRDEAAHKYTSIVTSIETMQQQLASALDQAERTADQNERLADLIEEKQHRIAELEEQLTAAVAAEDELTALHDELAKVGGDLENRIADLDDRDRLIDSLRSEIDQLSLVRREGEDAKDEVQVLLTQLQESNLANSALREKLAEQTEELQQIVELQEQIEELDAELEAALGDVEEEHAIRKELENKLSEKDNDDRRSVQTLRSDRAVGK